MTDVSTIPLRMNDGREASLADWAGKVVLLVNVASKCGLTPQYAGIEALYRRQGAEGLAVIGVPSNDFLGQEPGSDAEIADFCAATYDVTFPLAQKTPVSGEDAHPLYRALTTALPDAQGEGPMRARLQAHGIAVNSAPAVQWNFEKFLIGRDGRPLARFAPDVTAEDARLLDAVQAALTA